MGDQSFRYLTVDEMKSLGDDSMKIDVTRDENAAERMDMSFDREGNYQRYCYSSVVMDYGCEHGRKLCDNFKPRFAFQL
jgi:hypothetical protein